MQIGVKDSFLRAVVVFLLLGVQLSFTAFSKKSMFEPAAPSAFLPTQVTSTAFTASWSSILGATGYRIDVSSNSSFSTYVAGYNNRSIPATPTNLQITGLSPGQTYYYRVRSFDGVASSANSNHINVQLAGYPPDLRNPTLVTSTSLRLNWYPVDGAQSYKVDFSTNASFTGLIVNAQSTTNEFYNVSGLTAGTTYYYRIRGVTSGLDTDFSATGIVTTAPAAPVASAATSIGTTNFTANWNTVPGATGYRVDVSLYSSFSSFIPLYIDTLTTSTSLVVSGLVEGQTYHYRVRAVSAVASSNNSNRISVTTLPLPPTANNATNITGGSFTASWTTVSGASEYRIDVANNSGFSPNLGSFNDRQVLSTNVSVTGLNISTTYYYRVRALTAGGASSNSNVIVVPGAPVIGVANNATTNSFTANWNPVGGAASYRIDVALDNGFSNLLPSYNNISTAGNALTITGLAAGETYYYRVRAVNGGNISMNSNTGSIATVPLAPVALDPTGIASDRFTANWNSSNGATSYEIDVDVNNTFASPIVADLIVTGTSVEITGLDAGETYYYRVKAVSSGGASVESNIKSVITIPGAPTANPASSITTTGFNANWSNVTGGTGFYLYVSSAPDFSSHLPGFNGLFTTATSATINSVSAGSNYYYRVTAANTGGTSGFSNAINVVTVSAAPNALPATSVTTSGFTAQWNAVSTATNYLVDVATDALFADIVPALSNISALSTSLAVTGLESGKQYYYRVRAVNSGGTSINSASISVFTVTDPPVANAVTAVSNDRFTAEWTAVPGALSYQLDVSLNSGFSPNLVGYSNLAVTGTSYVVNGLGSGQTYYFRVRGVNTGGISLNSNAVSTITLPAPPSANPAHTVTASSFVASWSSVTGAVFYSIDVATDIGFSNILANYDNETIATTSIAVTSLSAGTTYYYRVRANNSSGAGAYSSSVSVVTIPPTPVPLPATSVTSTAFVANWSSTMGAVDYKLDVSLDPSFGSFVGIYNNYSVTGVSASVTPVSSGNTYYYRVRASNSNGTSNSSPTITVITIPNAPTATAASSITGVSFVAHWSGVASATDYRLDVSTNASFSSFVGGFNDRIVNGLSESVTGLSASQTYYYRVRAVNGSGASSNSNTMTVPGAPVATVASGISNSGFTATWNFVTSATNYYLDVSTDHLFTFFLPGLSNRSLGNVTDFNVSGLTPGTRYFYRVRAESSGGISTNSNSTEVVTVSSSPSPLAASNITGTSFDANWSPSPGATSYRVDVATDNAFTSIVSSYNNVAVSATTLSVSGLNSGVTYYYRVRAFNSGGTSVSSGVITVTTIPVAPVAAASTLLTSSGFTANWAAVTGATGYRIDVASDDQFSDIVPGYNDYAATGTSAAITGLSSGTVYYYRVRATNSGGVSANSLFIEARTLSTPPSTVTASVVTTTSFSVSWNNSFGAFGYRVDVATNNTFTAILPSYNNQMVFGNTIAVSDLSPGTNYYVRVKAVNAGGTGDPSTTLIVTTVPSAPVALSSSLREVNSFKARWNTTVGASNYRLDVATDILFTSILPGYNNIIVNGLEYDIVGLNPGTTYYYQVRAESSGGISVNSNVIEATTLSHAPALLSATAITTSAFTANWAASSGATSYRLEVATDGAFGSIILVFNNLASTSHNVAGLNPGVTYFYRVRANNNGGAGAYSLTGSLTTIPSAPVALAATAVNSTSFIANWAAVTGAVNYRLDVSSDPSFNSFIGSYNNLSVSGGVTQISVTGLQAGHIYYYRLRAESSSGQGLNSSTITVVTVPSIPTGVVALRNATNSFVIKWNLVNGATGYRVDVSSSNTFGSFVSGYNNLDVSADSVLVSGGGITPGTRYYFRVRAYTSGGTSLNSSVGNTYTRPLAPTAAVASAITATGFTANWTSNGGVITNYRLDVNTQPDFSVPLAGYDNLSLGTSPLSRSVTGISPNTTYFYRLRAENLGGQSTHSNVIIVPGAPVATMASSITTTSFVANWNPVIGASGYRLEVIALPSFTPVVGYEDLSVSSTSQLVTGLAPNTSYRYRVRAVSNGGTSVYSNFSTVPAPPVASSATAITANGFEAHWSSIPGAIDYRIDVALSPAFDGSFVAGYQDAPAGSGTAFTVSGLLQGTAYYYRVRAASEDGSGLSSNVISLITVPSAPVAVNASNVSTDSFTAHWFPTIGAASYRIDVATSPAFESSSMVFPYQDYTVFSNSISISGLTVGSTYYYRVRAVNGYGSGLAGTSSNTIAVKTGSVVITAPSLNGLCTNSDFVQLGDIVLTEGSNDVFKPNSDSVTFVLSMPSGFELKTNTGAVVKIQGGDISEGIKLQVSPSTILVKYIATTASGIEDAFKITGLMVRAIGSATTGEMRRSGGNAEQAGNNIGDALAHATFSSNNTTPASIQGLGNRFCINAGPVTLIGSPDDNDGVGGVVGVFSGNGVSGNVFDPAVAGVGLHTITYSFTNLSGCTSSYSQTVLVNFLTPITFNLPEKVCNENGVAIPLIGSPAGGIFTGDKGGVTGTESGGFTFYPNLAQYGDNEITYTYKDGNNCTQTITKIIKVEHLPVAHFGMSDFCDGKTIEFFDSSTVLSGDIESWSWNFGDANTSNLQNPTHYYEREGEYTISLTVVTNSGCSSTKTIKINIGKTPSPVFEWENACLGNSTKFTDKTGIDDIIVKRIWDFGDGFTSQEASPSHIFSASGLYTVTLTIITNSNCSATKSIMVPVFPSISSFPYFDNFEGENNDWVSGGVNSSWERATPAGSVINKAFSGTNVWITSSDSVYNNNEKSFIEGPCFNLSGLVRPMISLKIWVDTDKGADGAVLQASTDNGKTWRLIGDLNQGIGWYDSSPIIGGPGGQQIMGWSGADRTRSWRDAKFHLDHYRNESSVKFRIAFGSSSENPPGTDFNGIAVDDIWIGERTHTVLVEHFMNNKKGSQEAGVISELAKELNSELIELSYHTNFPQSDPINLLNPVDPSARALFYGISEVPNSILDGVHKVKSFGYKDTLQYRSNVLKESKFNIDLQVDASTGVDKVRLKVNVESHGNHNSPVIIYTAVVQKYEEEGHLINYLRKMLPDAAGIFIDRQWSTGSIESAELDWFPQPSFSGEELGVVVFVQDKNTKEVYQSVYKKIDVEPGLITGIEEERESRLSFTIYPNPTSSVINITIPNRYKSKLDYILFDGVGHKVAEGKINAGEKGNTIHVKNLPPGLYTLHLYDNRQQIWAEKVLIVR